MAKVEVTELIGTTAGGGNQVEVTELTNATAGVTK